MDVTGNRASRKWSRREQVARVLWGLAQPLFRLSPRQRPALPQRKGGSILKIGLFTYHFSDNYGALYQAYGLREWLRQRGADAEFVNYHPSYVEEGGPFDRPWKPALWRKNATILYMQLSQMQRRVFGDKAMRAGFEAFRRDYLGITGPALRHPGDLHAQMAGYDMLISGSDQIWNPSIQRGLDPVYFLDIPGAERARKVSYAPSFGRSTIEPEHHAELARLARGLDGISVREESGRAILAQAGLAPDTVHVVPDPTILLGGFDSLLGGNAASEDAIFCYALRTDAVIRNVAEAASTALGAPLVSARNHRQRWRDIGTGAVPTPVEWLRMLARARLVVSNSFHGVALSIILNRPFIAVALPGKKAGLNARVINLLELTGLQDRLVTNLTIAETALIIATPIDWEAVNARLSKARGAAETYLEGHMQVCRKVTA